MCELPFRRPHTKAGVHSNEAVPSPGLSRAGPRRSGFCGACKIEIIEGGENLNILNQEELNMGDRDRTHRLACQAVIKQGFVKIKEGF